MQFSIKGLDPPPPNGKNDSVWDFFIQICSLWICNPPYDLPKTSIAKHSCTSKSFCIYVSSMKSSSRNVDEKCIDWRIQVIENFSQQITNWNFESDSLPLNSLLCIYHVLSIHFILLFSYQHMKCKRNTLHWLV